MNRYTLKFLNVEQEYLYSDHMIAQQRSRILQSLLASALFCIAASIYEFLQNHLTIALAQVGIFLGCLTFWILYSKNQSFRNNFLLILTATSIGLPYAALYILTMSDELTLEVKVIFLMVNSLTLQYLQVYQNFIVSVILHINEYLINGISLLILFGPNIYILMYVAYSLFWLTIEYQTLKDKRLKFQAAHINQSLWEIIDKSVKNKIVSFTYDEENIKFELELCNRAAKQYLVEDQLCDKLNLSQILRNIQINTGFKIYNLGNYISQKYINNQQRIEPTYLKFNGFYQTTTNKLKLRLYVQHVPKLKFILNIRSYNKHETMKQSQGWLISKYETMTVKILNRIASIIQSDQQQQSKSSIQIKKVLNTYQAKLKLLNVMYSSNYQLTIKEFNIVEQLRTLFMNSPINYKSNLLSKVITSDYSLTKLLFQLIIKYIGIVRTLKMRVTVEFQESREGRIGMTFKFKGIELMNNHSFTKLFEAIDKLVQLIGIRNSLKVKNDGISFDLVTNLEPKFIK